MGEFYFGAGGEVFGERVAKKLKYHRLKPGGVLKNLGEVVCTVKVVSYASLTIPLRT